ncbi:ABC transporter ATP-binding protein [Georgenia sp. Z1344]|uniref:ABC transporter ATP-binding protein n=1 Tax=Georgenia sp. Z1344 TaxID=3416706 RepID=UPI003CEDAFC9
MEPIIRTERLSKVFDRSGGTPVRAVDELTVDVAPGTLTAFLGPNGAGKSTAMRMLTTLLTPTSGAARVCGFDVSRDPDEVRARIGYVGQKHGASQNQRVRDELLAQGALFGLPARAVRRRVDDLLDALDLAGLAERQVLTLSGGQRRRVDIALGLVPAPRLLVLDEPTTGLDPQARANLWEHVTRLRREDDMTVLLTTHYLEEADRYAERVLVVDGGRIVADGTGESLKRDLASDRIHLDVESARLDEVSAGLRVAGHHPTATGTRTGTGTGTGTTTISVPVPDARAALPTLVADLAGRGVVGAWAEHPTLDDVFLGLTGRSLRDGEHTPAEAVTSGGAR